MKQEWLLVLMFGVIVAYIAGFYEGERRGKAIGACTVGDIVLEHFNQPPLKECEPWAGRTEKQP